jgi:hypothetical protein
VAQLSGDERCEVRATVAHILARLGQPEETLERLRQDTDWGHLSGNEQVDLSPMVIIICQTFVNRLAILQQADDVVDGDAGTLDNRGATPDAGGTDNVTIGFWRARLRAQPKS